MRVVAKKNGKFKIVGLARDQLVILRGILDYMDDDMVVSSLAGTCFKNAGLQTEAKYIVKFGDNLFSLINSALDGDD